MATYQRQPNTPFGSSAFPPSKPLTFGFGSAAPPVPSASLGLSFGGVNHPSPSTNNLFNRQPASGPNTPTRIPFGTVQPHQVPNTGGSIFPWPGSAAHGLASSGPIKPILLASPPAGGGRSGSPSIQNVAQGNSRRRRRSESPNEEDAGPTSDDTEMGGVRRVKKIRREIKGIRGPAIAGPSAAEADRAGKSGAATDVDVGKALATLSKPDLLTVLSKLLAQQPALASVVVDLLPPPSLDAFTQALGLVEQRAIDSVPRGIGLREEYVWSRVRSALEEYIAEGRHYLAVFCPSANVSLSGQSSAASNVGPNSTQHPSTTFQFLAVLSASIQRIEAHLPQPTNTLPNTTHPSDPLSNQLLPLVINNWHILVGRLSSHVNQNGGLLSADVVRGWFRQLDEAASSTGSSEVLRRAMEGVRESFIKELGWLIGLKPQAQAQQEAFQYQQQQQQVSMGVGFQRRPSPEDEEL